ncbi:class I SAM-dependent methyltransferase [Dermacoccaceae bacterium W4C1]
MSASRPVGIVTRGTTGTNRLRRCDRWLVHTAASALRRQDSPLVVDLGYGANGGTTEELFARLRRVCPQVSVVGLEIAPERVAAALHLQRPGLSFGVGGFEVPLPGGRQADVIRAFNVLRQYDEDQVPQAWDRLRQRLTPGGLLVEGTCDEVGRIASWVHLDDTGPQSLTISLHLGSLTDPAIVAERLPKALIHRNVPGERVHRFCAELSRTWQHLAPLHVHGARQRFVATAQQLREAGWPVIGGVNRWRLGELTVAWDAVAPD